MKQGEQKVSAATKIKKQRKKRKENKKKNKKLHKRLSHNSNKGAKLLLTIWTSKDNSLKKKVAWIQAILWKKDAWIQASWQASF